MISFCGLKEKEVINTVDGRCFGVIIDVEIDTEGRITAIVLPGPSRLFGLVRGEKDYVIPWERIRKIGKDVILVDIDDRCLRRTLD